MANSIQRDAKKRNLYHTYELQRIEYKSLLQDLSLSKETRSEIMHLLNRLPRNSSPVRVVNRCILTGRAHGVLRRWKLSRIKIRECAAQGALMGVTKSSW